MSIESPSLPAFEQFVATGQTLEGFRAAVVILRSINAQAGRLDRIDMGSFGKGLPAAERARRFCTRFAAAFGGLLSNPAFELSLPRFEILMIHHRWLDLIFSVSGFGSSDHLLPRFAEVAANEKFSFARNNATRVLAAYTPNSDLSLSFERILEAVPVAGPLALLQYLSSRYVFRPKAFEVREKLLQVLPKQLDLLSLSSPTLSAISEIYMHCSYAAGADKHAIKAPLIRQMRRACLEAGCVELSTAKAGRPGTGRPTAIVTAEHFSFGHSIYRTHSLAVRSLREKFHLVGIVHPKPPGPPVDEIFDEVIPFPSGEFFPSVKALVDEIRQRDPAVIFHLGVGMVSKIIALASLRLAPVQCASFGHTATTMSHAIDYMILPEDFVGDPKCFSEKIVALPAAAIPFEPPMVDPTGKRRRPKSETDGVLRIAIAASIMKLNAPFFATLARIAKAAKARIEFAFFPLAARGLAFLELQRVLGDVLPGAVVYAESPYDTYIGQLAECDFFLCPFPYGNMNSIIDAVALGLPGICLDGPEAHAHADAAMFARLGFPEDLTTQAVDAYVTEAVRMADDKKWRQRCRDLAAKANIKAAFYDGRPELFCDAVAKLVQQQARPA